jgi:hypothetical protein
MRPQEVTVGIAGKSIQLIDTPGLFWEYPEDASTEDAATLKARDILLRSRGRIDHLKDPLPPRTASSLHLFVRCLTALFLSESHCHECKETRSHAFI